MTESMSELLAKLKELDPETWRDFKVICNMTAFDDSPLDDPNIDTPVFGWSLQGVIQDAIAADDRFLFFEVRFTSYFDVKYEATIFWDGTGSISQDGYGETAAEAILAAYIAALEAGR